MTTKQPLVRAAVLLIFAVVLLPLPVLIWMSFFNQSYLVVPPSNGYTADWYLSLPEQRQLFQGLTFSLGLAACTAVVSTLIGVLAAFGIRKSPLRESAALQSFMSLPLVVPAIVSSMALYIFLFTVGSAMGLRLTGSFGGLLAAHVLITLPWAFRLTYAGVLGINADLERASEDLGSSRVGTFLRVSLPLVRTSVISAAILVFIFSFGNLEMSMFLTAPGQTTLPVAMMQHAEIRVDPTLAAMAVVQLFIVGALLLIGTKVFGFGKSLVGGIKQ
jgi:putative spermidine/putrescine transport system permease protein